VARDPHVVRADKRLAAEKRANSKKAQATAAAAEASKTRREQEYAKDHPSDDPIAKFTRVWGDSDPARAQARAQERAAADAAHQSASGRNGDGPEEGG
jgi:hypothetical protein